MTAIRDLEKARRVHVEESLAALPLVERFEGPIVDVGAGGGAPGIPLAAALPKREVTLLEANRRKCDFLREVAREFANVRIVHGRAEEQETDVFGVAVAKALAQPPVALEWCLPLVHEGGGVVLYVGPSADLGALAAVSEKVGGGRPSAAAGVVCVPKVRRTPPGFPRRTGIARKRPLA
ncbi:MAG: RsmG family class I SAM-dependent methyltransferase [Gaiellaceae bacterium]